jgi:hypothetical protein
MDRKTNKGLLTINPDGMETGTQSSSIGVIEKMPGQSLREKGHSR